MPQQDAASLLKKRFNDMLKYISQAPATGRHVIQVEGFMLDRHGISPSTTDKYLLWAEKYGKIKFTNVARNVVKSLEV